MARAFATMLFWMCVVRSCHGLHSNIVMSRGRSGSKPRRPHRGGRDPLSIVTRNREDLDAAVGFAALNPALVVGGRTETVLEDAPRVLAESYAKGTAAGSIDLHGLFKRQAVKIVGATLIALREVRVAPNVPELFCLSIIVGRGSHSGEDGAVLRPAIIKMMEKQGTTVGTPPSYEEGGYTTDGGCLIVQVAGISTAEPAPDTDTDTVPVGTPVRSDEPIPPFVL